MKIMQIMPEFELAGAEIMAENLTYALRKKGHEVVVISMYEKHTPITDRLEADGVKIHYLGKKSGFDLSVIGKMKKVFKAESPDVIHTHRYLSRYAIPAAVMAGVKGRVHTLHSVATMEVGDRDKKFNSFFYRHMKMQPVAISPEIKKTVEDVYKLPPEKIGMVYNGINIDKCTPKTTYEHDGVFTLVHIGRFQDVKNHDSIIRAFSQVHDKYPDTRLCFYGQGVLLDDCKKLACELGLSDSIEFCGVTSDVYSVLTQADAFLLCSHYEGMPMTLIEAMASGLPIVATAVGGIVDMIEDHECGLLCRDDVDDIAEKICTMVSDPALREKCGREAVKRAHKFSSDSMADGYIEIYNKVLKK